MNARETRIRIINIQEQHCRGCEYLFGSYQHCIENCEWGKAVYHLGTGLSREENTRKKNAEWKWDQLSEDTVQLRRTGLIYVEIAKRLKCRASSLRYHLKKRGLYE
ncbi:hypothetical protein CN345_06590 [Bacillus thuringiensis]|uniref:hypothetical protein n=1 Tax=Bacillus thuringiensis TaxID=1428 RepID=UPI000BF52352|nr:hypothetical protein [Bacillus thuringiensis]PEZ41932.1 hypothetical protein CN345_06590 [Bacillus thuringiensis]PGY58801.1 hypothetical protein COE09_10200 [Bacillus thuringiensis]